MVIVVEIEDRCGVKPFLGGWRNVVTGAVYHDARTQTCPRDKVVYTGQRRRSKKQEDDPLVSVSSRVENVITKTRYNKCVGTNTTSPLMVILGKSRCKYTSVARDIATQTSRLPDLRDKLVTPLAAAAAAPPTGTPRTTRHAKDTIFTPDLSQTDEFPEKQINANAEKHHSRLEEDAAAKIQKCYRAYRERLKILELAHWSRETRAPTPPEPEKIRHLRHCRVSQFEIINAEVPTKRSDFQMLENVLSRWRFYENARLNSDLFTTSKMAARATILHREILILRSIAKIKNRLRNERKQRRYLENLDHFAKPEVWTVANGRRRILVDTLRVQRARECRDFYRSLIDNEINRIERLETLKKLRSYVGKHTCKYAEDLVSLIDQEILLSAGNFEKIVMNCLRNRLRIALLRFTTNFCATSDRTDKNVDSSTKSDEIGRKSSFTRICKRCGKLLTIDDLSASMIETREELNPTCENCRRIQTSKDARIVYEPYEIMLRELRNREIDLGASVTKPIAWIVDTRLIYRLVNYVWHGKSGISECDDPYRLVLVRFRKEEDWSPWNNLVMTKQEAALHRSIIDPWQIYASTIMKKFIVKNLQAKLRFDFTTRTNFYTDSDDCTKNK